MVKIGPKPTPARPCPICGKANSDAFRPFCSKRCSNIDLGRWFSESYAVPSGEAPEADGPGEAV